DAWGGGGVVGADLADDSAAGMDADGNIDLAIVFASEPMVEVRDHAFDRAGRAQRTPRGAYRHVSETEQRADAIGPDADEGAIGGADRIAERVTIERQQVKQVLRQLFARELFAVEKVAEHHDDFVLARSLRCRRPVDRPLRLHQRHDRYVPGRAQLTGEAHVG